jgi:putative transposase
VFGISRQAYYKRIHRTFDDEQKQAQVINLVKPIRREQSRLGTLKVFKMIQPTLNKMNIKLGRDRFYSVMRDHAMLIRRKKNFVKTTNSNHRFRKHPNLIKGNVYTKAEQVWVSDITYIKTQQGYLYLSLITDLYSKKIMGYNLSDNMKVESSAVALRMAIANRLYPDRELIHHSDRGFQYCADNYTQLLEDNNIKISMTQSYDPYENAVAERVNGILKGEYDIAEGFVSEAQAQREIKNVIKIYNTKRPHISCDYFTPVIAHIQQKHKPKFYSRLLTNKHILTKEKRSKKEKATKNSINFKS